MPRSPNLGYSNTFQEFDPLPQYIDQERVGEKGWSRQPLEPITSKNSFTLPRFEETLNRFLKDLWKPGVVNNARPQNNILAQGRHPYNPGQLAFHVGPQRDQPLGRIAPEYRALPPTPNPIRPSADFDAGYLQGIAKDWEAMFDIHRVVAYSFRGDTRAPLLIQAANGFHPPSTRNDEAYINGAVFEGFKDFMMRRCQQEITLDQYKTALAKSMDPESKKLLMEYSTWRRIAKREEFHLGRMLANELLKGYISTTRAVTVAKGYVAKGGGWVYCLLVKGGYRVPQQLEHEWTQIYGEEEIAFPGSVSWEDVWGFRQVNNKGKFEGPVTLRRGFHENDPHAAQQVLELLSGKRQG